MTSPHTLLHRLADANGIAWEDIPDDLAREVRAALSDSTPSPAPVRVSGAEPERGDGVSARACWDCAHDSLWTGGGICLLTCQGKRHIVSDWIRDNCTNEPLPGARNCPGWAPRRAGEVSDG